MDNNENTNDMTIDEIFCQVAKEQVDRDPGDVIMEEERILGKWENPDVRKIGYNDLRNLIGLIPERLRANASEVINTISFYKSDVATITSNDGQVSLLLLDDIGLVIDLFHEANEEFIGNFEYDSLPNYIYRVLNKIGHPYYHFQTLSEAYHDAKVCSRVTKWKDLQVGDIASGYGDILGKRLFSYVLTDLFRGERNWNCNFSYAAMAPRLDYSLLPFHVICYECLPYVKEVKEGSKIYCIETKMPLDDVNLDDYSEDIEIAIFSNVCSSDPSADGWTGETTLRFLGVYNVDKEKSRKENHFAFKQKSNKLSYL